MAKGVLKRFLSPWLHLNLMWKLSSAGQQYSKDIKVLKELTQKAIERAKQVHQKEQQQRNYHHREISYIKEE
jgi:hypothetical protein